MDDLTILRAQPIWRRQASVKAKLRELRPRYSDRNLQKIADALADATDIERFDVATLDQRTPGPTIADVQRLLAVEKTMRVVRTMRGRLTHGSERRLRAPSARQRERRAPPSHASDGSDDGGGSDGSDEPPLAAAVADIAALLERARIPYFVHEGLVASMWCPACSRTQG